MDVLERAQQMEREGRSVVHMEIGEPDFDTPEVVRQAAIEAIGSSDTRYTHSLGLLDLREAISEHYEERYGVKVDPRAEIWQLSMNSSRSCRAGM